MDSTCEEVDYERIDAPKHFVDFKNMSNFDDDGADKWFGECFTRSTLASLLYHTLTRTQPRLAIIHSHVHSHG